jgi:hypothetical protein
VYIKTLRIMPLKQLEDYEADHGCVVVMEAKQVMLRQFQTWEELKMVAIMKPQIMLLPSHTNGFYF